MVVAQKMEKDSRKRQASEGNSKHTDHRLLTAFCIQGKQTAVRSGIYKSLRHTKINRIMIKNEYDNQGYPAMAQARGIATAFNGSELEPELQPRPQLQIQQELESKRANNTNGNSNSNDPNSVTVDGAGLWANFTRTFRTPIEALLDILDNGVDAAFGGGHDGGAGGFKGKIRIDEDCFDPESLAVSVRVGNDEYGHDQNGNPVGYMISHGLNADVPVQSGIVITNNSSSKIKNINDILTVFKSSKGDASESIGQNGVGLKQGCAAIADLSFILIKNGAELSLGLVAKDLQKEGHNPNFPRFELGSGCVTRVPNHETNEYAYYGPLHNSYSYTFDKQKFEKVMRDICANKDSTCKATGVGQCIATYGGGNNLKLGISRLANHFERMFRDELWSNEEYVFTLVMNHLRQKVHVKAEGRKRGEGGGYDLSCDTRSRKSSIVVQQIFKDLKVALPKTYIHIPDSLDFRIRDERIVFKYWQKRLVELTSITQEISKSVPLANHENIRYPQGDCYDLRLFLGFDAVRAHDQTRHSSLSMCVYSKKSGRRVLHSEDARSQLRLTTSGTNFGQGLTLIVDDHEGNLTLNPRKDGIAFGEEDHPNIHEDNLYQWLGVIAKTFWTYHASKFDKKTQKQSLTKYLLPFAERANEIDVDDVDDDDDDDNNGNGIDDSLPHFSTGDFTKFDGVYVFFWKKSAMNLSYRPLSNVKPLLGKDTTMRIEGETCKPSSAKPKKTSKKKASSSAKSGSGSNSSSKKRKANGASSSVGRTARTMIYIDSDTEDDYESDSYMKKVARKPRKNKEKSSGVGSEFQDLEEENRRLQAHANAVGQENETLMEERNALKLEVERLKEMAEEFKGDNELLKGQLEKAYDDNARLRCQYERLRESHNARVSPGVKREAGWETV